MPFEGVQVQVATWVIHALARDLDRVGRLDQRTRRNAPRQSRANKYSLAL